VRCFQTCAYQDDEDRMAAGNLRLKIGGEERREKLAELTRIHRGHSTASIIVFRFDLDRMFGSYLMISDHI